MKMNIFQVIGCTLLVGGIFAVTLLLLNKFIDKKTATLLFIVFVASGMWLIIQHRESSIKLGDFAEIKAKAETYVGEIQEILKKVEEYHKQVEAHSHTVNLVAKEATEARQAVEEVVKMSEEMLKTMETLAKVQKVYEFADHAQMGSKAAYLSLKEFAAHREKVYGRVAKIRLLEINRDLQIYRQIPRFYEGLAKITNKETIPFEKLSLDEIVRFMNDPTMSHKERHTCMVYIKKKPKEEVFKKALEVLKNSDSLYTCAAFCGVLSEVSIKKSKFLDSFPFDFEEWISVCEEELNKE
ncbi:MAG: hypothetical protein JRG73_02615 [Deltaproteobacteria bacterium]|nr:hypothetical protein [Deltaproteobacteria bacterium]MBW2305804.1 hypothetical protein [Deltaproteobacteria bacterium]